MEGTSSAAASAPSSAQAVSNLFAVSCRVGLCLFWLPVIGTSPACCGQSQEGSQATYSSSRRGWENVAVRLPHGQRPAVHVARTGKTSAPTPTRTKSARRVAASNAANPSAKSSRRGWEKVAVRLPRSQPPMRSVAKTLTQPAPRQSRSVAAPGPTVAASTDRSAQSSDRDRSTVASQPLRPQLPKQSVAKTPTAPARSSAAQRPTVAASIDRGGQSSPPDRQTVASRVRARTVSVTRTDPYPAPIQVGPASPPDAALTAGGPPTRSQASAVSAVRVPGSPASVQIGTIEPTEQLVPTADFLPAYLSGHRCRCGVQCPPEHVGPRPGWGAMRPIPWEVFAQGEYIGPARSAHMPEYRLRVDDVLAFVYRLSGQVSAQPYRLNVRDRIRVESLSAPEMVDREVLIQPDGTITLRLLGQVRAAGSTIDELRTQLEEQYKNHIQSPQITVTPLVVNSTLEELRSSIDRRQGIGGGQARDARVTPDGLIQLPGVGSVPAQGLTLDELEREIENRYAQIVEGLEVTPILAERAPRYVFVVGEVRAPGRYTLEGPTTVMQAIALAGSWNVGARLNHVVIYRRDENWRLMATKANVRSSLLHQRPCPSGEIWLRDSDVVLVPKSPILIADDAIDLLFTRGLYGVFPMNAQLTWVKAGTL